jgi:hypothetical protein
MRVLICDQETEMLETIARSFEVDVATSKATCIDLMRANSFDVLVASERLSDGSGLELLSHVATRWPDTLRVLVIEPQRLKLIRGKLSPFRLHATMKYPIDLDELEAVLIDLGELLGADGESEEAEETQHPAEPPVPARVPTARPAPAGALPAATRPSGPTAATAGRSGQASYGRGTPPEEVKVSQVFRPGSSTGTHGGTPQGSSRGSPQEAFRSVPPSGSASAGRSTQGSSTAASSRNAPPLPPPAVAGRSGKASGGKTVVPPVARFTAPPAVDPSAPPVKRKLGNYTPLGAPEDEQLRIVERQFDQTVAPLAARAIRAREEATRPRTVGEKARTFTGRLKGGLRKLLKKPEDDE